MVGKGEGEMRQITITWYDKDNDFTVDLPETETAAYMKQQVYAMIMGWA